jgi:hypothetical protein
MGAAKWIDVERPAEVVMEEPSKLLFILQACRSGGLRLLFAVVGIEPGTFTVYRLGFNWLADAVGINLSQRIYTFVKAGKQTHPPVAFHFFTRCGHLQMCHTVKP